MVGGGGERGVTYLAVIIGVAVVSAVLAASAQVISHALQRDRERQLLWVGEQYRRALVSYSRLPKGPDTFPAALADLVEDRRNPVVQRHLRRVYFDPLTGSTEWGLIRNAQQRIIGVYSTAKGKPIKRAGFTLQYAVFAEAKSYADWRFGVGVLQPPRAKGLAGDDAASTFADDPLREALPGEVSDVASTLEERPPAGAAGPGKPGSAAPAVPGAPPPPASAEAAPAPPVVPPPVTPPVDLQPPADAEPPPAEVLPEEVPDDVRGVTIDAPVQAQ